MTLKPLPRRLHTRSTHTRLERHAYQRRIRIQKADTLLVYALYDQRRIDDAEIEALEYYRRHPEGEYTTKLVKLVRITPPQQ